MKKNPARCVGGRSRTGFFLPLSCTGRCRKEVDAGSAWKTGGGWNFPDATHQRAGGEPARKEMQGVGVPPSTRGSLLPSSRLRQAPCRNPRPRPTVLPLVIPASYLEHSGILPFLARPVRPAVRFLSCDFAHRALARVYDVCQRGAAFARQRSLWGRAPSNEQIPKANSEAVLFMTLI